MRIMLLDDDRPFLQSLEILLTELGHDVDAYRDAGDAVAFLVRGGNPDVLLLDYAMPHANGLDFLDWVRGRLPWRCQIILLTGHLTEVVADPRWRPTTVAEVLLKPVDGAELLEALERAAVVGVRAAMGGEVSHAHHDGR